MLITKCDICKKEITDSKSEISIGIGFPTPNRALCGTCGKPVMAFLAKKGLVKKETAKVKH